MKDDRQLVEACLAGEVQAFAALVDRYRYPVYGICLGYTKDFDAAEDAAQEAFIASYLKLGNLPEPEAFGPWLQRIAVNQCRMWWRRQRRRTSLGEEQERALVDPAPSPEERVVEEEDRRQVLAAIAQLSEAQQQVVVLFYLRDLSLRQIADFLGASPQSVEQRLYRARLRLKEEMLDMVEKTLKGRELPEDFTDKVVAEALDRGEKLLAEKQWSSARDEFRRITDILPDHPAAQRGLALALNGTFNEELRREHIFDDEELVQETFTALRRAYDLGSCDDDLIRALSGLYQRFGRHREGGEFLEAEAERRDHWLECVQLLGKAIAVYYHAYYKGDAENMAACVRCHRRIRRLIPQDMEARRKLDAWRPAGFALAYAHVGASDEVFSELDALQRAIAGEWSVYDHFSWTLAYTNQYRETEQWAALVEKGREFVDWAKVVPADDARLSMEPLLLNGKTDTPEKDKVGEWVRWWTMLYTLNGMIQAEGAAGRATDEAFGEIEWVLEQHEAYLDAMADREKADQEKGGLSGNYMIGGTAAYKTGRYAETVRLFKRSEELLGRSGAGPEPIYTAAALVSLGELDEAKVYLHKLDNRRITIGIGRAEFAACREFDAVREDPDIAALVESWKRAEASGWK